MVKNKNPKLSIISNIYNVENYLPECLDSIVSQSYRDFEVVLIDDGSEDSCPIICDRYAKQDSRLRVTHVVNEGLCNSRNRGLESIKGDYVMFVDPDDYICKDSLKEIAELIDSSGADVIIGRNLIKDEINNITGYGNMQMNKSYIDGRSGEQVIKYLHDNHIIQPAVWRHITRKAIIDKNHLRFRGRMLEDIEFTSKLFTVCDSFKLYDRPFYVYRKRKGSVMHTAHDYASSLAISLEVAQRLENYRDSLTSDIKKDYISQVIQRLNFWVDRSCSVDNG